MASQREVFEFIKESFQEYGIPYNDFFDDDLEEEDNEPGFLNMPMVAEAAKILGVETDDLLNLNEDAVYRWFDKYPFLIYKPAFDEAYRKSFHDDRYKTLRLMEVLFDRTYVPNVPTRSDYDDIIHRLWAFLKETDKSIPGTYHKGAKIQKLLITTQNFCHFDHTREMVFSYIDMFHRAKALFFKAWNEELSREEIHEYNFLVAAVGLKDDMCFQDYLFYDLLKKYIPVYRKEGYKEFLSYVRISRDRKLCPWRSAEFVADPELVQEYVNICPSAKKEMRKFAMQVGQFACSFEWSDAKPLISSEEELQELNDIGDILGDEPVTMDDINKELTFVYIPKTKEELAGDDVFAEKLRVLSGSASLGGVRVPEMEYEKSHLLCIQRMASRVEAKYARGGAEG